MPRKSHVWGPKSVHVAAEYVMNKEWRVHTVTIMPYTLFIEEPDIVHRLHGFVLNGHSTEKNW